MIGIGAVRKPRRVLLAAALLALPALLTFGAGAAQASCDNWQGTPGSDWSTGGNWSSGLPTGSTDVCISTSGPVLISAESVQANSLTLSGNQELDIEGTMSARATLTLSTDSSVASGSTVLLESSCTAICTSGITSTLTVTTGTLTNSGTIESAVGGGDPNDRILNGNITNSGTGLIKVQAPFVYGADPPLNSTLHNQGMIELAPHQTFVVPNGESSTVFNDTGGQISNAGGSGLLGIGAQNTFNEGGGTTTPATATAANPPVIIDGSTLGATLKYTGTGASTVYTQGAVAITGNLAHSQNLVVQGSSGGCPASTVTSASSFTNAGTITLLGSCSSGVKVTSGTLTNTGTIVAATGATRELKGNVKNSGTLKIQGPTAFDGPGKTLTQTAGTTTISPNEYIDLTHSAGTFQLMGGLLDSPGSSTSHQGGLTGSLNNSGGNVAPGSTTAPGDFSVTARYTQGAGGTLTAVLNGTQVGKTYSQLGVGNGSTLGGTLNIVTHSGFHPAATNLFTVLGGSRDTGRFAKLLGQFPAGATVGYKPLYGGDNVTLEATVTAKLTVKLAGTSKGTVTSSPKGINCGTTCAASFFKPQSVTLTEHPTSGHKFTGWSGACTGKTTTCKVKMTKAQSVTATFS